MVDGVFVEQSSVEVQVVQGQTLQRPDRRPVGGLGPVRRPFVQLPAGTFQGLQFPGAPAPVAFQGTSVGFQYSESTMMASGYSSGSFGMSSSYFQASSMTMTSGGFMAQSRQQSTMMAFGAVGVSSQAVTVQQMGFGQGVMVQGAFSMQTVMIQTPDGMMVKMVVVMGDPYQAEAKRKQQEKEKQMLEALEILLDQTTDLSVINIKIQLRDKLKEGKGLSEAIEDLTPDKKLILAKALFRFAERSKGDPPQGSDELLGLVKKLTKYEPSYAEQLGFMLAEDKSDYGQKEPEGIKKLLALLDKGQNLNQIVFEQSDIQLKDLRQLRDLCLVRAAQDEANAPLSPMKLYCQNLADQAQGLIMLMEGIQKLKRQPSQDTGEAYCAQILVSSDGGIRLREVVQSGNTTIASELAIGGAGDSPDRVTNPLAGVSQLSISQFRLGVGVSGGSASAGAF